MAEPVPTAVTVDLVENASEFWLSLGGAPNVVIVRIEGDQVTQATTPEATTGAAVALARTEQVAAWAREKANLYGAGFVSPAPNYMVETKVETPTTLKHEFTCGDISTAAMLDLETDLITFEQTAGYTEPYYFFKLWAESIIVFLTLCRDSVEDNS